MEYRIIKREGCDNQTVYECQVKITTFFRTIEIIEKNRSAWKVWCGIDKRPAIFSTLPEAESFIRQYKNSVEEEVVFTLK